MKNITEFSDEEIANELADRARRPEAQGASVTAGVPGIPPFVLALLKKFAGPALVDAANGLELDSRLPKGAGKTLPAGHEEVLGEGNARGGHWEHLSRLKGPRQ